MKCCKTSFNSYSQASKWISQGHRPFDDLRDHANLTNNQKIGLDHYDDFLARIPRGEVELHGKLVREAVHLVDKDKQVIIGGSYRRGAADSGCRLHHLETRRSNPLSSNAHARDRYFQTVRSRLSKSRPRDYIQGGWHEVAWRVLSAWFDCMATD